MLFRAGGHSPNASYGIEDHNLGSISVEKINTFSQLLCSTNTLALILPVVPSLKPLSLPPKGTVLVTLHDKHLGLKSQVGSITLA